MWSKLHFLLTFIYENIIFRWTIPLIKKLIILFRCETKKQILLTYRYTSKEFAVSQVKHVVSRSVHPDMLHTTTEPTNRKSCYKSPIFQQICNCHAPVKVNPGGGYPTGHSYDSDICSSENSGDSDKFFQTSF